MKVYILIDVGRDLYIQEILAVNSRQESAKELVATFERESKKQYIEHGGSCFGGPQYGFEVFEMDEADIILMVKEFPNWSA